MTQVTENGPLEVSEQDERKYRHITLPNKLQVLLISDPDTDKASACLDTKVGCMSDPNDTQGIAHFLEHMLFMGTEKFPDENEYSKYLNAHGGSSNAYTDSEDTVYYFDVNQEHLKGALDRFAQFFISPLFTEAATGREMNAVDAENAKNQQADVWRLMQLKKSLARPSHPYHNFGTGNLETLKVMPEKAEINLRERLLKFHADHYSSNLMRLVVLGKESLDDLQGMAVELFTPVPNKDTAAPSFEPNPYEQLGIRLSVVPVKDSRTVELTWVLPSAEHLWESKPQSYLSHLLGHEGPGSVLSYLKARGWANSLYAGPFNSGSAFSVFGCQVECTDEGIEKVDEVVGAIYAYLGMLKRQGPQEWVFNESRDIALMNFRFKSKSRPINYTVSCATSMQHFPPHCTLSGGSLFYKYDPAEVTAALEKLTPSNMLLTVASRTFEGLTTSEEQWYKTNYSVAPLAAPLAASWSSLLATSPPPADAASQAMAMPLPNDFVATDFSLKAISPETTAAAPSPPEPPAAALSALSLASSAADGDGSAVGSAAVGAKLVLSDEVMDVWYKHFGRFVKPKANVMCEVATPAAYESPESMVLTNLFSQMCKEELNEFAYSADLAGLRFSLDATRSGLEIGVFGYSHKLSRLLDQVASTVASPVLEESMFERLKDRLMKSYKNFAFSQPYQHAMFNESSVVETPRWSYPDRIAALGPLTAQHLKDFSNDTLLARAKFKVFVHGNSTASEAVGMAQTFLQTIQSKRGTRPLYAARPALPARVVALPCAATTLHASKGPNPEDRNSAVEMVFQVGPEAGPGYALCACLRLLMHLVSEPCFDDLRTKQQLGYLVFSGMMKHGDGSVLSARFIVQSESKGPEYLDGRVEAFLGTFREFLATELDPETFATNVLAVVEKLVEKDKNLNEETDYLWSRVLDGSYDYDRRAKEAQAVQKLDQATVLAFFDRHLGLHSSERRKLSVQVFGSGQPMPGEKVVPEDTAAAVADGPGATGGDGSTAAAAAAEKEEAAKEEGGEDQVTAAAAAAEPLAPAPVVPGEVIVVESPPEFQRTRPLYPFRTHPPLQPTATGDQVPALAVLPSQQPEVKVAVAYCIAAVAAAAKL